MGQAQRPEVGEGDARRGLSGHGGVGERIAVGLDQEGPGEVEDVALGGGEVAVRSAEGNTENAFGAGGRVNAIWYSTFRCR